MSPTDEEIEALKAKHGELHLLTAKEESVVVKPPTRAQYGRFREYASSQERRGEAFQKLLSDCVVWPDVKGLDALLARLPGLAETFGGEVAQLAGLTSVVDSKKL